MKIPDAFNDLYFGKLTNASPKQCSILKSKVEPLRKSRGTQTDYRESETQTIPWNAPYKITSGTNLEILTLDNFTWDNGLPAGVHEVEIIKRMRKRRAWEAMIPPMNTNANIKTASTIIAALEAEDWAFREKEIEDIHKLHMELNEKIMKNKENEKQKKTEYRLRKYDEYLNTRRSREINNIKHKFSREFRKLDQKYSSGKTDIHKRITNLENKRLYSGETVQKKYSIQRKVLSQKDLLEVIKRIDTEPNILTIEELKSMKPKPKKEDLCIRETKWSDEKLRELYEELREKRLNVNISEPMSLLERKIKIPSLLSTPRKPSSETKSEDEIRQSVITIQQLVRGRGVQSMMYEGRERCRELIEELRSTHALEEDMETQRQKEKTHMINLQQEQSYRMLQEDRLSEILDALEGMTVSGLLDYLSKELIRLKDERKAHAFALLAERTRQKREAEEAGRRQAELEYQRELDDMFRHITKSNQESVELFLEEVLREGIEWVSEQEARSYIANKMDETPKHTTKCLEVERDQLISEIIYNFILTEVDKCTIRQDLQDRQGFNYNKCENVNYAMYDSSVITTNEEENESSEYSIEEPKEINKSDDDTLNENLNIIREIFDGIISLAVTEHQMSEFNDNDAL